MQLHELKPAAGAHKPRRRVGRGLGSGRGTTAGRGTKGQKARSGGQVHPRFEGGQLPIVLRLPRKRGGHAASALSQFLSPRTRRRVRGNPHLRRRMTVSLCHNSEWRASPH